MARYEHLPIYRAAFDLAVHVEKLVRGDLLNFKVMVRLCHESGGIATTRGG